MNNNEFQIFISYRRDGGNVYARLIYEVLKQRGYKVFLDQKSLSNGKYENYILETIDNCKAVIVVLSKNCFARCENQNDLFHKEFERAINKNKNVIPVFLNGFEKPENLNEDPSFEAIDKLLKNNGVNFNFEFFDATIDKIEEFLHLKPEFLFNDRIEELEQAFSNEDFIKMFSETAKNNLLKNICLNRFGNEFGNIADAFVHSTLNHSYNFRDNYNYNISISSHFSFPLDDIDESKYYKLEERFSYTKKYLNDKPEEYIWISFITDLQKLDSSLKNESFLFSENLNIDAEDLKRLSLMSDEEKLSFYTKYMKVKLNINGNVLVPDMIKIDESGIFAKYNSSSFFTDENTLIFRLKFYIPHKKGASYFFVSISDPTYSPEITFSFPEDEMDVKMIPFLNYSSNSEEADVMPGEIEFSIKNEWIFPVGGVVFILT